MESRCPTCLHQMRCDKCEAAGGPYPPSVNARLDAIEKKLGITPASQCDTVDLPPMPRDAADRVLMVLNTYCAASFIGAQESVYQNYQWEGTSATIQKTVRLHLTMKKGA